jgi:SSS family solute:Na+ symporter
LNHATAIIALTILFSFGIGVLAGRRVKMNLEMWTVGGRRFGLILVWLLMAGEIYTTFTFLGAAGWAYSKGAPAFYILIYGALAYTLSFFILPAVWKAGKRHGLHTQPDFFVKRYDSRLLGALVALIGVASILPYLQLQLMGLGIIVKTASGGQISSNWAMVACFVLTCVFVYTSGIRGTAWVAVLKDIMMIIAVGVVGVWVPYAYFGGIGKMFGALVERNPAHLVFPGSTSNMDSVWVMSTVLLTAMGFYMWPHTFASVFSAQSAATIKRNSIIMPLYQVPVLLVFLVGFTALLVIPGLANGDEAFLALVAKTFPAWFLGFVGAAGAVTAMVPSSLLILCAATLLSKNVYQLALKPSAPEATVIRLSRVLVVVLTGLALAFAIFVPKALVALLLLGYDGVTQFFPGVVLGLFWKRVSRTGVLVGLLTGLAVALVLLFTGNDPWMGVNAGFVALLANAVVAVAVSLLAR